MNTLQKFWFRFERTTQLSAINVGCGVTAFNKDDALDLIRRHIFDGNELPKIIECIENVTIDQIEQKHARPNVGEIIRRGIWFPQGYT